MIVTRGVGVNLGILVGAGVRDGNLVGVGVYKVLRCCLAILSQSSGVAIARNSLAMLDWELVLTTAVRRIAIRALPNKAIVAIARKLLIAVWHVLSERASDKNAISEMVAFKLMVSSW